MMDRTVCLCSAIPNKGWQSMARVPYAFQQPAVSCCGAMPKCPVRERSFAGMDYGGLASSRFTSQAHVSHTCDCFIIIAVRSSLIKRACIKSLSPACINVILNFQPLPYQSKQFNLKQATQFIKGAVSFALCCYKQLCCCFRFSRMGFSVGFPHFARVIHLSASVLIPVFMLPVPRSILLLGENTDDPCSGGALPAL